MNNETEYDKTLTEYQTVIIVIGNKSLTTIQLYCSLMLLLLNTEYRALMIITNQYTELSIIN